MYSIIMATVEVQKLDGERRWLHKRAEPGETAPVRLRNSESLWIQWGGMIRHDGARAQVHACAVLIPITAWSLNVARFGWTGAGKTQYLQGCLVRTVKTRELVVFGITMGNKPRIVDAAVKPALRLPEVPKEPNPWVIPRLMGEELEAYLAIGWYESQDSDGLPILRWPKIRGRPIFPVKDEPVVAWLGGSVHVPAEWLRD
jgi:hypothetical protein